MTATNTATGGCACGAIRYQLQRDPLIVHCCHCSYCQRETGSAFAVNILIEATAVSLLQGKPVTVDTPSASGAGQLISRCAECHVALLSHYSGFKDTVSFIRAGTLDDATRVEPDVHIYTSTRMPFVILPDGIPAMPEYYRMREVWSDSSIERYQQAKQS